MNTDEKIRDIMHKSVKDMQERMDSAGVNASGRTRNSLQVRRIGDGEYQIIQYGSRVAPFDTIERGRGPGKVPYKFSDILVEWSRDKGIQFESERERKTFAYFLSKKIREQGTPRPGTQNPRPLQIIDPVIAKANRDIRIVTSKSLLGYINANIRYAMDTAKSIKKKISDFFKWG